MNIKPLWRKSEENNETDSNNDMVNSRDFDDVAGGGLAVARVGEHDELDGVAGRQLGRVAAHLRHVEEQPPAVLALHRQEAEPACDHTHIHCDHILNSTWNL